MPIVRLPECWGPGIAACDTGRGLNIVGVDKGKPEGNHDVCIVYGGLGKAKCGYVRYAHNRRHAARLIESISCFEKLIEEEDNIIRVFDVIGTKIEISEYLGGNAYHVDGNIYGPGYVVQIHPHMVAVLGGYALDGVLYVDGPLNWAPSTYFVHMSAHFDPMYAMHRLKIIPFSPPKLYV